MTTPGPQSRHSCGCTPPTVDTVEQLDALPFLALVREVLTPSPIAGCDYGGVWERRTSGWECLAASLMPPRHSTPRLPARVIWTPPDGSEDGGTAATYRCRDCGETWTWRNTPDGERGLAETQALHGGQLYPTDEGGNH